MSASPSHNAAALKCVWKATKGIFKNKNKRTPRNVENDDIDSSVFVFQTPDRPMTKFLMTCPPPAPEWVTKKAEMCSTESVLKIVCPTPPEKEETKNEYATWIQERNARGHAVRYTPLRSKTSTSSPLKGRRPVARKVKFGDAATVEEMRMAARTVAKRLQTVY